MDELKNPRKKADGIRRQADPLRSRSSATPRRSPEKIPEVNKEVNDEAPKKKSFLEQSASSMAATRNSQVIHDTSFKKEVLPVHFSFLKHKNIIALVAGLGITLITASLLSTIFARVTLTVKPTVERIQIDNAHISFDASLSDMDPTTQIIPSELLSFNASVKEDFNATGTGNVDQKASGHVRIYNAFGTSPQALVAHTRFISDAGILFRLPKSIIIPGAKKARTTELVSEFIEADLVADKSGEGSNISGEVKLHIPGFKGTPKYDGFYAVAQNGFSGGSIGQGRVVTRDDLSAAQQKLSKKVFDDLKQSMIQKIPAAFTYVDSLSQIEITSITAPKEKTKTDRFTVEVKAVAHVFVFRNSDMMKLVSRLLLNGDNTKSLIDRSADFHYQIKNANYDKKIADVTMSGSIKSKKVIVPEELAVLAAGKKEGSLIDVLKQRRDISTFRVAFFPPWIFSVPNNAKQIVVIIEDPTGEIKSTR